MLEIKTWRDPYDSGFSPTRPRVVEFKEGLTVLVGCNGAGKSTLIQNIKDKCFENKIPCYIYNNLRDGGNSSVLSQSLAGLSSFEDDFEFGVSMWTASEGEAIKGNIGRQTRFFKKFEDTGMTERGRIARIFDDDKEPEPITDNRRIYLFDAIDSGLSIDIVNEFKGLFYAMIKRNKEKGLEPYIIAVANEYELARGEDCFDVNTGKYITFSDYEDYRGFILKSRANKEKRIEKQKIWYDKQAEKELAHYEKRKAEIIKEREKYIAKVKAGKSYLSRFTLDNFNDNLKDLRRNSKYVEIKDDFLFDNDKTYDELKGKEIK